MSLLYCEQAATKNRGRKKTRTAIRSNGPQKQVTTFHTLPNRTLGWSVLIEIRGTRLYRITVVFRSIRTSHVRQLKGFPYVDEFWPCFRDPLEWSIFPAAVGDEIHSDLWAPAVRKLPIPRLGPPFPLRIYYIVICFMNPRHSLDIYIT